MADGVASLKEQPGAMVRACSKLAVGDVADAKTCIERSDDAYILMVVKKCDCDKRRLMLLVSCIHANTVQDAFLIRR